MDHFPKKTFWMMHSRLGLSVCWTLSLINRIVLRLMKVVGENPTVPKASNPVLVFAYLHTIETCHPVIYSNSFQLQTFYSTRVLEGWKGQCHEAIEKDSSCSCGYVLTSYYANKSSVAKFCSVKNCVNTRTFCEPQDKTSVAVFLDVVMGVLTSVVFVYLYLDVCII